MRNRKLGYLPVLLLGSCLLLACCSQPRKAPETTNEVPIRSIEVPIFNPDSSYRFIQEQLAFGPRIPNTSGHRKCLKYLVNKLHKYGAKVVTQEFEEQAFDGTKLKLRNIIASFQLGVNKRILLAAHWDTRPWADKEPE